MAQTVAHSWRGSKCIRVHFNDIIYSVNILEWVMESIKLPYVTGFEKRPFHAHNNKTHFRGV